VLAKVSISAGFAGIIPDAPLDAGARACVRACVREGKGESEVDLFASRSLGYRVILTQNAIFPTWESARWIMVRSWSFWRSC
jgi:hypothetical protein